MLVYNRQAELYTLLSEKDSQIEQFNSLIEKNKTYPYLHKQLGDIYLSNNEKEKALREYKLFLELAPSDAIKSSIEKLVLELTPPLPLPPPPVAIACESPKPKEEKKKISPKVVAMKKAPKKLRPKPKPVNFFELAQKEHFKGNYQKAIELFTQELAQNPKNSTARFHLARAYTELLMYDQAIVEYNKVLASKKIKKDVYKELGLLYYEIGESGRSIKNLLEYLKLETDEIEKQKVKNLIQEIQT